MISHMQQKNVTSPNTSTTVHNVVHSIVYRAMITICGREMRANPPHQCDRLTCAHSCELFQDKYYDDNDVIQWRNLLYDLVQNTIRFCSHHKNATLDEKELRTKMFDIEIRTATAYFQRYCSTTIGENGIIKVLSVVSDMGISRDIYSSYQLSSEFLLPLIEQEFCDLNISNHVRVAMHSGFIAIISVDMMHFIQQKLKTQGNEQIGLGKDRSLVLESCPICPLWCRGSKGLWWHLQQQHHIVHNTATATANIQVNRNSTALVVYHQPLPIAQQPTKMDEMKQKLSQEAVKNNHMQSSSITNHHETKDDPWMCIKREATLEEFIDCVSAHHFDCRTTRDKHGALILHWAAGGGHIHIVQYLIATVHCDANAKQRGKRAYAGRTALHWAARYGHTAVVQYLIQHMIHESGPTHRSFIDASTEDGTTPFCWAAWQGHLSVLKLLHTNGCQVDIVNHFGCNAILWAAQGRGDMRVFEWLIQVGCPDLVINHSGHGILHKGAQRGRRDLCLWFIDRLTVLIQGSAEVPLCKTSPDILVTVLKQLGPDNDGCTPSDLAGMEHHEELAVYLSEQEQSLVAKMAAHLSSLRDTLPNWLTAVPKGGSIYSNSQRRKHHFTWEPGAGVFRMRSVLSNVS